MFCHKSLENEMALFLRALQSILLSLKKKCCLLRRWSPCCVEMCVLINLLLKV